MCLEDVILLSRKERAEVHRHLERAIIASRIGFRVE